MKIFMNIFGGFVFLRIFGLSITIKRKPMENNKVAEVNKAAMKAQTLWVRSLKLLTKLADKNIVATLTVNGKTDTHSWKFVIENHENGTQQFRICVYAKSTYSRITAFGEYKWNEKPSTESLREHFRTVSRMND